MVADGDDARKPGSVQDSLVAEEFSSENATGIDAATGLFSSGLAEINLEIHQSMVFFERNDIGNV